MRDIPAMVGARSVGDRLKRIRPALDYLTRGTAPPIRIAPDGAEDRAGYGFELLTLAASSWPTAAGTARP